MCAALSACKHHQKDGKGSDALRTHEGRHGFQDDETNRCSVDAGAQQRSAKGERLPAENRVLIVYLSRTNNTKAIAEIIHEKVGGKLVALELADTVSRRLPRHCATSRAGE